MQTFEAIEKRRSIRKFTGKEIPAEIIEKILNAAILAPSAKNRQPWKFIVVTGKEKPLMLEAMRKGFDGSKGNEGLYSKERFPEISQYIAGAEYTLKCMEQAPVNVFVFNTEENYLWDESTVEDRLGDIANIQSIGAAIQNMLLTATDLGVGSLWICDVFFAYREICEWLNEKNQLIAAVAFGYTDEQPNARPRKKYDDVVKFRG